MSGRKPLGDATARVNNAQPPPQPHQLHDPSTSSPHPPHYASPNNHLPHHESLKPNGNLAVLNSTPRSERSMANNVENHRLSAVASDYQQRDPNRNSQISTTSTNASKSSRRKTHVGPWQLGATLGRGATARVRKARHAVTGQTAAIKIVSKAAAASVLRQTSIKGKGRVDDGEDGLRQMPFGIEREVVIMKLIEHPNVIRLYDIWENRGELYLVLEYVEGGELFHYLSEAGFIEEHEAVRYFRQILAGLTYCHQFNICHRDLKPENILMDKDKNIKLADFGMAALQPANLLLNTSCGSPHYAAPEIFEGKRYHGSRVDIWSCGIILYAMLVGCVPFDDVDVVSLFKVIKTGQFDMPDHLSLEAQNLLWRMLQVNPEHRITMDQIWRHPLVKKYDIVYGIDGTLERNVGPPAMPSKDDIGHAIKRRMDIDGEILRNLQTLWHGETQQTLIQRLLSPEVNQEKFFYHLLLKYREKHLEDYQGPCLEYSTSDYHHSRPIKRRRTASRQLGVTSSRSSLDNGRLRPESQFSIVSSTKSRPARPRSGYYENPDTAETIESYDPFRSSRVPVHETEAAYANVTVLRGHSTTSRATHNGNVQHPAIQRLHQRHRSVSRSSLASSSKHQTPTPRKNGASSTTRRYESKSSLASSSIRQASSPLVIRPSSSHKRRVSFSHLRRGPPSIRETLPPMPTPTSAIRDGAQSRVEQTSDHGPRASKKQKLAYGSGAESVGSPSPDGGPSPRSRKTRSVKTGAINKIRAVRSPRKGGHISHLWRDEARQVSSELERFCDEAFNRSSVSSSVRTAATTAERVPVSSFDSPISSFSIQEDSPARRATVAGKSTLPPRPPAKRPSTLSLTDRPLPPVPKSAGPIMDPYTERQLAVTREKLIQRSAQGTAGASQGYLDDVIAHLDRLMQPSTSAVSPVRVGGVRNASATADCTSPDGAAGYLPAISEERYSDHNPDAHNRGSGGYRASSEPMPSALRIGHRPPPQNQRQHDYSQNERPDTIRLVQRSSPVPAPLMPVAPLNVRKRSGASTLNASVTAHTRQHELQQQEQQARLKLEHDDELITSYDDEEVERIAKSVKVYPSVNYTSHAQAEPVRQQGASDLEHETGLSGDKTRVTSSEGRKKSWFSKLHHADAVTVTVTSSAPASSGPAVDATASKRSSNSKSLFTRPHSEAPNEGMVQNEDASGAWPHLQNASTATPATGAATGGKKTFFGKMFSHRRHAPAGPVQPEPEPVARAPKTPSPAPSAALANATKTPSPLRTTTLSPSLQPQPACLEPKPTKNKPTRNWFLRHLFRHPSPHPLFHPRPYTSPLCFSVSKPIARAALLSLLRSWKRYGLRDVVCDRSDPSRDVISARVDRENCLGVKAVVVEIEVFGVLERESGEGRKQSEGGATKDVRRGLAVARMRQVRGAGSSFWMVVREVERGLRSGQAGRRGSIGDEPVEEEARGVLIERGRRWDEMVKVLEGVD